MSAERTNDIENRFSYHPATTPLRQAEHEALRNAFKNVAHFAAGIVPAGREQALMLTALEEAMFWGNAGVARQQ